MRSNFDMSNRQAADELLVHIADYAHKATIESPLAIETARYCLMDTLGCGMLALRFPECVKHLGPIVPGTQVPNGARVPGTQFVLDPVQAAFNIGTIIRWLDFNDTWLASEWGHPSDNLGGIVAVADYLSRQARACGRVPITMGKVLEAMIKAHEIQGILALHNSFNRVGLDHVVLVKVASTAVISAMIGLSRDQIVDALTQAFVDGQSLRTYRHAPNTGSRKSWAAGDATSRAVRLALITQKGEMGLPSVLTAKTWGFYDVLFGGNALKIEREFGSYVMENVLFKISYPAEFHAQTAVEAAVMLHPKVCNRIDDIERIVLTTHESAIRIISKVGVLANPADRDHCLQYMVACGLLFGTLVAEHYEDDIANDPRIDKLRSLMQVEEDTRYSQEYHHADKRSIANAIEIIFNDGTSSQKIEVEYPIGHKKRRDEGIPLLKSKFSRNIATRFPSLQAQRIEYACNNADTLANTAVDDFVGLWTI